MPLSMETKRPQLNLRELHQLRWLLGGSLALLSAWTVFYMEVDALLLLALTTVAVPLFTLKPGLAAMIPAWADRLAFPLVVAIFAFDIYQTREPLPAMIRLDLMLLLYRSIMLRTRREDLQLILLSLFLVVVAGVLTVSLGFAVQILMFTACALSLLLMITLCDAATPVKAKETGVPGWARQVDWRVLASRVREVADVRVVLLAGVLFAGVVGVSVVLFLAFPRFELNTSFFLDRLMSKKASRTGFSENVRFGDVVDIMQDNSLAMMVDVSDREAVPAEPYWRMLVLDEYIGGGFRMSRGLRNEFRQGREKQSNIVGAAEEREGEAVWTIYMEPGVSRYLPVLGNFRRMSFTEPQAVSLNAQARLVSLQLEPLKMLAYRVEGMAVEDRLVDTALKARLLEPEPEMDWASMPGMDAATGIPPYYADDLLDLPPPPPRYLGLFLEEQDRAKLAKWVEEIGPPKEGEEVAGYAQRAVEWLWRSHGYSLSTSMPPGENDVLVRWMGSAQPGHCELFAGALVLLSRSAGVPARVVTGFKGGTWNPAAGGIMVRNADAHAWCELFDGEQWLRVDPTPGASGVAEVGSRLGGGGGMEWEAGWRARINSLRLFWYRRIVSFDQGSQVELVRTMRDKVEGWSKWVQAELDARMRALAQWMKEPWDGGRLGMMAGVGVGLGALVWGWRGLNLGMRLRALRGADPVRREAGRWLRRFERVPEGERPGVHGELQRLRYGRRETWQDCAGVFKRARREIRAAMRR